MATSIETFTGATFEPGYTAVVTVTVQSRLGLSKGTWSCTCDRRGDDGTRQGRFGSTVNTVVLKQAAGKHAAECDGTGEA